MAIAPAAEGVAGVVAVDEVDAPGSLPHPVDDSGQLLTGRPGVAGVEAEARSQIPDLLPQLADHLHLPGHRVAPRRRVLDEDGNVGVDGFEGLAPAPEPRLHGFVIRDMAAVDDHRGSSHLRRRVAALRQHLAARDAHPVVGGSHVDEIGAMDVQNHLRIPQLGGVAPGQRGFPGLRVGEEHLYRVGVTRRGSLERLRVGYVSPDEHHSHLSRGGPLPRRGAMGVGAPARRRPPRRRPPSPR